MPTPHVVIVGGGFAGLAATRALRRAPVRVTLVDRRNHHLFQPLLYQVATAGLAPSDIAEPIRSILRRHDNVSVRLASVSDVDLSRKRIRVGMTPPDGLDAEPREEWLEYDRLVLAAGAHHSYFSHPEWETHAPGLKTIGDALEIRGRMLTAFERAEWAADEQERDRQLTFVVVGGGPTGVELAGALAEIAAVTMRRDFRNIRPQHSRVVLLEGGPAVLGTYPEDLRQRARTQLEDLGVDVRLHTLVTGIDAQGVDMGDARVEAATVLWAAGVQASAVANTLPAPRDRAGRVEVEPDCSLPGHPDVFVVGDLAHFAHTDDGSPLPGLAPVATQMGAFVGRLLAEDRRGADRGVFRYRDKGSMATIGRSKAVMDAMGLRLSGWPAWMAWVLVHVLFLITFRNRVLVMTKWAWAWFTYERAVRLIWQHEPRDTVPDTDDSVLDRTGSTG